jgi:hypothetical protein
LSILYGQGSLQPGQFIVAIPDFVLGLLFAIAFLKVDAARQFSESFSTVQVSSSTDDGREWPYGAAKNSAGEIVPAFI